MISKDINGWRKKKKNIKNTCIRKNCQRKDLSLSKRRKRKARRTRNNDFR